MVQKRKDQPTDGANGERRKRRSAEDLTSRILEAARGEFQRCGYAGATTAAIARAAEVTEAQLFRYFGSKANLFREAVFRPLDGQLRQFLGEELDADRHPPNLDERATLYIEELQRFLAGNAQLLTSLMVAQKYDREMAESVGEIESLAAYFERGASTMTRRMTSTPKVDPKLMVRVSFAGVLGCVLFKDWIFPPGMASEDEIRRAIDIFISEGVSANFEPPPEPES